MPKVKIPQLNKILTVKKGENLFQALRDQQVPIASSCGGDAVCGKCIVSVSNEKNISPPNGAEKALSLKHNWQKNVRVSCQISVHSDIEIETTYW